MAASSQPTAVRDAATALPAMLLPCLTRVASRPRLATAPHRAARPSTPRVPLPAGALLVGACAAAARGSGFAARRRARRRTVALSVDATDSDAELLKPEVPGLSD